MKAQSDNIPEKFVNSNGKTQVNYNINPIQITDDKGTRTAYTYDYVEIEGVVTRQKVLDEINKQNDILTPIPTNPDDVVAEYNNTVISKSALQTAYINAITTLQTIQNTTAPTNAQVIAGVKAEAQILEKLLNYMKSQIS
jgi:hypothetical protein